MALAVRAELADLRLTAFGEIQNSLHEKAVNQLIPVSSGSVNTRSWHQNNLYIAPRLPSVGYSMLFDTLAVDTTYD